MKDTLSRSLALLSQSSNRPLLAQGLRGVERETLRVTPQGALALTPHPIALGAALTHPQITTDYSESLLEFITPALPDIATALNQLDAIHRFAYTEMPSELVWSQSMPSALPEEADIPIAWFGQSHIGMLKHVYRRGLALRYGKTMQCIAGIHYNFSVAEDLWGVLHAADPSVLSARDYQSDRYIAMIRNFQRYSWLLMYLFGASPALDKQFLHGLPHGGTHPLKVLSDDTLYLPDATSLRMSDLGYQNDAQSGLIPPYNSMLGYMRSLAQAVRKPYAPYAELGMLRNGEWWQINTNVLQIENEYYATVRPKRVIRTGERPLEALCARGIQYIEVRCMDVDPFEPTGISLQTARFLDAFLTFCALDDSPLTNDAVGHENDANFSRTVKEGRRPGLLLQDGGVPRGLTAWGAELLERIAPVAALLDAQRGDTVHADSLAVQRDKLAAVELTPSAKVLTAIKAHGNSYAAFGLAQSVAHAENFRSRPLTATQCAEFKALAQTSLAEQVAIESAQTGSFDDFIADYRSRTPSELCG